MLFPIDTVREVAQILQERGLGEISLETAGVRLTLKRPPYDQTAAALATPGMEAVLDAQAVSGAPEEAPMPVSITISSPAVGVFREAKTPLQVGDEVAKKANLGAVETLNIPTELVAPQAARVLKVLAIEGQRVEWGQPLLELEPVELAPTVESSP